MVVKIGFLWYDIRGRKSPLIIYCKSFPFFLQRYFLTLPQQRENIVYSTKNSCLFLEVFTNILYISNRKDVYHYDNFTIFRTGFTVQRNGC